MINSADEAPEVSFTGTGYTTQYGQRWRPSEMKKTKRRFSPWWTSFWVRGSWWDSIFVASCVIAVSLDPLFFYIPIIDRERKCLQADIQLRTATIILRSLMDITFIVHIIYQIREAMIAAGSDKMATQEESKFFYIFEYFDAVIDNLSWRSFITDILSVLPIPQVLLLIVFFKMRGPGYLDQRKILNFFLLAQYLARIYRIHTFMSMETEKSEEIRRKIKSKEQDMKVWMEKNCLPENLRKEIMVKIREKLEQDKHADVENLFSILPWATKKSLKRVLCMSTLRKVPILKGMNPKVLKMICDYLRPVIYPENSYVAKVDEPVDRMVLVTEGTMWIYSSNSTGTSASNKIHRTVENGGIYGDEQLLSWVSKNMQHVSLATIPISTENVKCHTRVEGFAITATDLKAVATKCKMYWNYDDPREKQRVASSTIGMSFRRNRSNPNRPATVGVGAATSPRTRIEYLQKRT
ncbi:hypothetical protein ACLB2K_070565 [Fragaria x ananassa]